MAEERERRERAAAAADAQFSKEFLEAAMKVFDLIDVNGDESLTQDEVLKAVKSDRRVIDFLKARGGVCLSSARVWGAPLVLGARRGSDGRTQRASRE